MSPPFIFVHYARTRELNGQNTFALIFVRAQQKCPLRVEKIVL